MAVMAVMAVMAQLGKIACCDLLLQRSSGAMRRRR